MEPRRKWYPVMLQLDGVLCVVVGGGKVGWRKAAGLLECGARVAVIAPEGVQALKEAAEQGKLLWHRRRFQTGDLAGAKLVFAAVADPAVQAAVREEARREGAWFNAAHDGEHGDFIVPSVVRRGRLTMAVATGGASPLFGRRVAAAWEAAYGEEYAAYMEVLARCRKRILGSGLTERAKRDALEELLAEDIPRRLRNGEAAEALEAELMERCARRIDGAI